jgi:hypothetical protein
MKRRSLMPHRTIAFLISIGIAAFPGCIHMTHPSNVKPGWSADIVGGVSHEQYRTETECGLCAGDDPTTGDVNVIQANISWGKRMSNGNAFRAGLMVPLSMNNGSTLGAMGGTTLDLYYQFMDGSFNAGAGGLVGLAVDGVYLEAGKTFLPLEGFELDIDIGVSGEASLFNDFGIRLFSLIGVSAGRWKAGIWADHMKYVDYLKRCDENCEHDDFVEKSVSGGLYVGGRF